MDTSCLIGTRGGKVNNPSCLERLNEVGRPFDSGVRLLQFFSAILGSFIKGFGEKETSYKRPRGSHSVLLKEVRVSGLFFTSSFLFFFLHPNNRSRLPHSPCLQSLLLLWGVEEQPTVVEKFFMESDVPCLTRHRSPSPLVRSWRRVPSSHDTRVRCTKVRFRKVLELLF